MKQSNHHFSFTISVNNTIDKVWQSLIDVQNWHKWDTEILDAKLDGEFAVGTKGIMKPKTGPKLKFYISEIIPNQSYTFNTLMPVGELVIKRSLIVENEQVHFTDDIAFTGFLKVVFGIMLGGQFRKVLPEVMNKFKKIAESK
jgi:Polyketide cyclase / dehydrase and lipid transport